MKIIRITNDKLDAKREELDNKGIEYYCRDGDSEMTEIVLTKFKAVRCFSINEVCSYVNLEYPKIHYFVRKGLIPCDYVKRNKGKHYCFSSADIREAARHMKTKNYAERFRAAANLMDLDKPEAAEKLIK